MGSKRKGERSKEGEVRGRGRVRDKGREKRCTKSRQYYKVRSYSLNPVAQQWWCPGLAGHLPLSTVLQV